MRYLLTDYDRRRFDKLDDVVRLCYFDLSIAFKTPVFRLGQIGTTMDGLSNADIEYVESYKESADTLNGCCFHGNKDFKIWINPNLMSSKLLLELTILHELCHGYIGPIMHSRQWRRFYGRAVILYAHLLNPDLVAADPEWQVKHTIRRYRGEQYPNENYGELVYTSEIELETVVDDMERNMRRLCRDFEQLQEMRERCHASTSGSTPTPAYLALQQLKAGTVSPLK